MTALFALLAQAPAAAETPDVYKNQWYFYAAYTLVWVLLLLYLVRLHLMIRELRTRQEELGTAETPSG